MSSFQINNGAEPVGRTYYDASTEEFVIEAMNGKTLRLKAADIALEYGPDAKSPPPPVGATYIQFPACVDPGTLWDGTSWSLILNDDEYGLFFRTEGTNPSYSLAFGGGVQGWAIQSHKHSFRVHSSYINHMSAGAASGYRSNLNNSWNGSAISSVGTVETRPRNVTIQIWRRDS